MKVLLTGANGFVGSHILDRLRGQNIATVAFLRPASSRRFIQTHLPHIEVRTGTFTEAESLKQAMHDVTHVVHCAGCVKALCPADFFAANQLGTRHVVTAVNHHVPRIERLVHISSLAAAGPALPQAPVREVDEPRPVSVYGKSKLAAEQEVRADCHADYVILRSPAVYGPRDTEFLRLVNAVKAHLLPRFGGGRQALSLVYAADLAAATVACLTHPGAARQTYFVAAPEVITTGAFAQEIAAQLKTWTLPLPLPVSALWLLCVLQDLMAKLTGKPMVLSRQKYAELKAPAWICDSAKLQTEVGFTCTTGFRAGLEQTLAWYRQHGWI